MPNNTPDLILSDKSRIPNDICENKWIERAFRKYQAIEKKSKLE
jgi:hypothetical protein